MDLTDEQWTIVEPLIPKPKVRADGRGRPWRDDRQVLNGILWILRTGAHWRDVPNRYPSPATCHRRHQDWSHSGVFNRILTALAERGPAKSRQARPLRVLHRRHLRGGE